MTDDYTRRIAVLVLFIDLHRLVACFLVVNNYLKSSFTHKMFDAIFCRARRCNLCRKLNCRLEVVLLRSLCRLRVVSNFRDDGCGASEIHTRACVYFAGLELPKLETTCSLSLCDSSAIFTAISQKSLQDESSFAHFGNLYSENRTEIAVNSLHF